MTSDRGSAAGAECEMQVTSTPVSPKTPRLNPNANVFHCKVPPTPPEPTSEWSETDLLSVVTTPASEGTSFAYVNGDLNGKTVGVTFPPTPESPMQIPEYQQVNGAMPESPADIHGVVPESPGDTHSVSNSETEETGSVADASVADTSSVADLGIVSSVPEDHEQLCTMLKTQLEYYFSRENLTHDSYLVSQMDADQYVLISTVANFNQVKRLTNDMNLVVQVLRESSNVQVDEAGEKVRPLHKRCVVILREIPQSTPVQDVENLFSGENCPRFASCEFAHNNNWYVTFNSDEDAQRAYQYLREEVRNFQGKPIMARIKAKPLMHSTFAPKNGFKQQYDPNAVAFTPQQPAATQQPQFTYTQLPNAQFVISQQSYPFFPPNTVVAPWSASPNPVPFFDPGTAFAANGYTAATTTFKLPPTARNNAYQNSRNRNQSKGHRDRGGAPPVDHNRTSSDSRMSHDRHPPSAMSRSSPRGTDSSSHGPSSSSGRRGENASSNSHTAHASVQQQQQPHQPQQQQQQQHHVFQSHSQTSSHSPASTPVATAAAATAASVTPATAASSHHHHHHHHNHHHHHPTAVTTVTSSHNNNQNPTTSTSSRQQSDSSSKEPASQPQSRRGGGYRSRRRRDDDNSNKAPPRSSASSTSTTSSQPVNKEAKSAPTDAQRFDLEATSFPPLPGAQPAASAKANGSGGEIFENKMSDVVKGTAKASTRTEGKPLTGGSGSTPAVTPKEKSSAPQPGPKEKLFSSASTPKEKASMSSTPTSASAVLVGGDATPAPSTSVPVHAESTASTSTTMVTDSPITASLPTPPHSPPRTRRSTSMEEPSTSKSDTSSAVVVHSQTSSAAPAKQDSVPRLSYAQMVQRTKEREAGNGGNGDKKVDDSPSDQVPSTSVANGTTANRTSALREQTQLPGRNGARASDIRKGEEPREQRQLGVASRRAKENRDRRDRDIAPRAERERFRERRRDREADLPQATAAK